MGRNAKNQAIKERKLNKEIIKKACELKSMGIRNNDIAAALGVSESTFYRWIQDGGATPLQRELSEGLKKAEAAKKEAVLKKILEHGNESWQALAWYLERVYPSEFGRVDRLQAEVNQTTSAAVRVEHFFDYGDGDGGKDE